MALSPGDPHSYARPELARVVHAHLELNVDFDRKVLQGKAILTIKSEPPTNEVILDNYGLVISSVRNCFTGSNLEYQIGECGIFGSKFTIQLLQPLNDYTNEYTILIEYETSPNSPALYWLEPDQTADGKHPFLLSNTKYIYARAMFPCQDTPSVKFTYTATISAPLDFTVLMSSSLVKYSKFGNKLVFTLSQVKPIPSHAVIIAVGNLNYVLESSSRFGVYVENKYILLLESFPSLSQSTEKMVRIAEKYCGVKYPWDSLNICVLPPSVSHFEIECPCLIFVSPTLLGGDLCLVSSIARTISKHWAGILVTSVNYHHLWLNKYFSIFICDKILRATVVEEEIQFIYARDLDDLTDKCKIFGTIGLLKCLLPKLDGLLPNEGSRYVPYEKGYMLLLRLQNKMGKTEAFEKFLESYLAKFAYKSIKTNDLLAYLRAYLVENCPNRINVLESIECSWFDNPNYLPPEIFERRELISEKVCISLAERWINWNDDIDNSPFESNDVDNFADLQKIYFLNYLRTSRTILSEKKMHFMANIYKFDYHYIEIRFAWLRLCIKSRWLMMVPFALKFAIKFCSPKFTYPIFRDLYEWPYVRTEAIKKYMHEGWKMLNEIQEEVATILHVNEEESV